MEPVVEFVPAELFQSNAMFSLLAGWISIYPRSVDGCTLEGEIVLPQPGEFCGGWITLIRGPFKGPQPSRTDLTRTCSVGCRCGVDICIEPELVAEGVHQNVPETRCASEFTGRILDGHIFLCLRQLECLD